MIHIGEEATQEENVGKPEEGSDSVCEKTPPREEQAEASGSDGKVEPLQGSGDGNGKLETTPSITSPPENTMVTHVSPGHVGPCHLQPALPRLQRVSS